jgi:hypothetical protein
VKWNEVLLADSLVASKTSVWKGSVTEPPVKKSAGSEKNDDFWEGLPLDWEMDGVQDEESLAILDALEEDIHRDKMIARQKTKGKRELLNLKSSINYGDANTSSKRWKGKALMM